MCGARVASAAARARSPWSRAAAASMPTRAGRVWPRSPGSRRIGPKTSGHSPTRLGVACSTTKTIVSGVASAARRGGYDALAG
jgi:hypothetical protein